MCTPFVERCLRDDDYESLIEHQESLGVRTPCVGIKDVLKARAGKCLYHMSLRGGIFYIIVKDNLFLTLEMMLDIISLWPTDKLDMLSKYMLKVDKETRNTVVKEFITRVDDLASLRCYENILLVCATNDLMWGILTSKVVVQKYTEDMLTIPNDLLEVDEILMVKERPR